MTHKCLLLLVQFPLLVTAQNKVFYNKSSEKVDSTAGFDHYDMVEKQPGGLWYLKRFGPNDSLLYEGACSTMDETHNKDVKEGLHQHYRKAGGAIWYTENYENGLLHGETRSYFPGGQLKRIEMYQRDTIISGSCFNEDGSPAPFTSSQQAPTYPGGEAALMRHFSENLKYPKEAFDQNISGTVVVTFVVNKDGHVSDVTILKDPGGGCGAEAVRLVESMATWSPGFAHDDPVKVRYTLPLKFKLDTVPKKKRKKH